MRNVLLCMVFLFLFSACGSKGSLDEETAAMLEARYGEPFVVEFSESGTLGKNLRETVGEKYVEYLRIVGPMNGADIDSLNEICEYVRALDLLDASIVAGVPCHYYGDEYPIETDNTVVNGMFNHLPNLEQIFLPLGTTTIGDDAFGFCENLEYIRIPNTVATIGKSAFDACKHLASMHLPEQVALIGESAFSGCESLKRIFIPKSAIYKGGSFSETTDVFLEWTPEDLAKLDSISFSWGHFDENPPRGISMRFIINTPTLHVPAAYVEDYKKKFDGHTKIVADDGSHPDIFEPTYLLTRKSVGPVKVGRISDIPNVVAGLYDSYEKKTETYDDFDEETTVDYIYFMKDGQMAFKALIDGDEIIRFCVYPAAKNVSTWCNVHAGDSVKTLNICKSWLEWYDDFDVVQKCTDNSLVFNIGNEKLKPGVNSASSLDDFVDDATLDFIWTKTP